MSKNLKIDRNKLASFLGITSDLRKDGAMKTSGNWLIFPSPYKWGDKMAGSDRTAGEAVNDVKALGFKSAWVRGGNLGVNVKDVAVAA